jgi:hypothetical protein
MRSRQDTRDVKQKHPAWYQRWAARRHVKVYGRKALHNVRG